MLLVTFEKPTFSNTHFSITFQKVLERVKHIKMVQLNFIVLIYLLNFCFIDISCIMTNLHR